MLIKHIWELSTLSRPLIQATVSLGLKRQNYTETIFHSVCSGPSEIPVSSDLKNKNSPSCKKSFLLVFHNMLRTVSSPLGAKRRTFQQGDDIVQGAWKTLLYSLRTYRGGSRHRSPAACFLDVCVQHNLTTWSIFSEAQIAPWSLKAFKHEFDATKPATTYQRQPQRRNQKPRLLRYTYRNQNFCENRTPWASLTFLGRWIRMSLPSAHRNCW